MNNNFHSIKQTQWEPFFTSPDTKKLGNAVNKEDLNHKYCIVDAEYFNCIMDTKDFGSRKLTKEG